MERCGGSGIPDDFYVCGLLHDVRDNADISADIGFMWHRLSSLWLKL